MDNLKEWAQALQDSMNFSKAVIEEAADRLAAYEDAEERGELVRVVRGRWVNGKCDNCGEHAPYWCFATTFHESNYCPNCGADMREGDTNEP